MFAVLSQLDSKRQMLWSLDLYSECNTGHANSQINDDPKLGQHGMQDCAFEIDNDVLDMSSAPY